MSDLSPRERAAGLAHPYRSNRRPGPRTSNGPPRPAAGQSRDWSVVCSWPGARCRTRERARAGHPSRARQRGTARRSWFPGRERTTVRTRPARTGPRGPMDTRTRRPAGPDPRPTYPSGTGLVVRAATSTAAAVRPPIAPASSPAQPISERKLAGDQRRPSPALGPQPDGRGPEESGTGLEKAAHPGSQRSGAPAAGICSRAFLLRTIGISPCWRGVTTDTYGQAGPLRAVVRSSADNWPPIFIARAFCCAAGAVDRYSTGRGATVGYAGAP